MAADQSAAVERVAHAHQWIKKHAIVVPTIVVPSDNVHH